VKPIDLYVSGRDRALLHRVTELLAAHWDPKAEFAAPSVYLNAAGHPAAPKDRRAASAHAEAILAMYGAGGPQADAVGYLRRAEEEALGQARTTGGERWGLAAIIWRWSHGHESVPASGQDAEPFARRVSQDRDVSSRGDR